jgi:methanogenic corrinoid protein MtbC1
MSSLELYKLSLAAQSRNRAESISGLVLYDEGRFFQWLEGPVESVGRIIHSIRNDPRHTDIEVIDDQSVQTRMFTDWSMKLAATGQAVASSRRDVMEPPPAMIAELRRNPHAAPRLLAALTQVASVTSADTVTEFRSKARVPINHHAAAILKALVVETVIPALTRQHGLLQGTANPLPISKRVWELADLLIADDQDAARELIQEVQAESPQSLRSFATLFEPAARRLGDLWNEDVCSEFDVTLSLARIQTAVRLLGSAVLRRPPAGARSPDVLIAPEPGELHGLGAALDSEVMFNVGWRPHTEFPKDDQALETLVAATWFDVLDLSLSAAFRRDHWLPRLRKTIAAARHASRNPALIVVVGGRLFAEDITIGAQVGADTATTTSVQVDKSIMARLPRSPE